MKTIIIKIAVTFLGLIVAYGIGFVMGGPFESLIGYIAFMLTCIFFSIKN
jgi:hypothetical protein